MSHNSTVTEQFLAASNLHLAEVLDYIDELHSAASDGHSQGFTGMSDVEVLKYLSEIIYTAQETINEIDAQRARQRALRARQPMLRIVPKIQKTG